MLNRYPRAPHESEGIGGNGKRVETRRPATVANIEKNQSFQWKKVPTKEQFGRFLEDRHSPREYEQSERLQELAHHAADEQNQWLKDTFGVENLINDEGSVDIKQFNQFHAGEGGYTPEEERAQYKFVLEWEKNDAGVERSPNARMDEEAYAKFRENRLQEYGLFELYKNTPKNDSAAHKQINDLLLRAFREEQNFEPSRQLETVVMVLFNKMVGDRFLVRKSSKYDDMRNHIDTVLTDKETGEIICTLDEVRGAQAFLVGGGVGKSQRESLKQHRTFSDNVRGGKQLAHGITFKEDPATKEKKLYRGKVRNLPILYASVYGNDLKRVIEEMTARGASKTEASHAEVRLFDALIASLTEQAENLATLPADEAPQADYFIKVQKRAIKLLDSLAKMKAMRDEKYSPEGLARQKAA